MNYRLSPSDLTYLYDGCKFCFWLKVKFGISQPSMPMPGIFSAIAGRQKEFYANRRTKDFCRDLPDGVVLYGERPVQSKTLKFNGSKNECHIRGRFDVVIKFDDGSYGVIDCKTASPSDQKAEMYGRQLQAYAFALENPGNGALTLSPVSKLGLIFFEPSAFQQLDQEEQAFRGKAVWIEVERDDKRFIEFLREVVCVLEQDSPPESASACVWCQHRTRMKSFDFGKTALLQSQDATVNSPPCPQCNGAMTLKKGKFGEFWSCQKYPECKGTRNVVG